MSSPTPIFPLYSIRSEMYVESLSLLIFFLAGSFLTKLLSSLIIYNPLIIGLSLSIYL